MPLLKAQVVLPYTSNLPADVVTNTLFFDNQSGTDPELIEVVMQAHLLTFYTAIYNAIAFQGYINRANAEVRWYDMTDPEPRIPNVLPLDLTAATTVSSDTPAEVSIVLAFHAQPISGGNQARRRGRIYLGGFSGGLTVASSSGPPRVSSAAMTAIANAAELLLTNSQTANCPWVVFSPTAGTNAEVVGGWIDNEPDTQRRRGVGSTVRQVWPD